MKKFFIALVAMFLFVLPACSQVQPQPPISTSIPVANSTTTGYPAPSEQGMNTAYPATTQELAQNDVTPTATSDPSDGNVEGSLFLNGKPVQNVTLYLANVIKDSQGRELVAGYDRTSLLRAPTDQNGHFTFTNISPGRYGVVLDLVTLAYLMDTPDGSQSLLLTVNKGETTNLGKLDYKALKGL